MKIDTQQMGTVDVLTPIGALTDQDAEDFAQTLRAKLDTPNPRIVLAMQEVAYFASQGIEGLVDAADDLQRYGGRLRLASVTQTCREVLELTGHAQRFQFFDDVQDAVRSFI